MCSRGSADYLRVVHKYINRARETSVEIFEEVWGKLFLLVVDDGKIKARSLAGFDMDFMFYTLVFPLFIFCYSFFY